MNTTEVCTAFIRVPVLSQVLAGEQLWPERPPPKRLIPLFF